MNGEDEAYDRGRAEGYEEGLEDGKRIGREQAINEIEMEVDGLLDKIRKMS